MASYHVASLLSLSVLLLFTTSYVSSECIKRTFPSSEAAEVCVCNATYCDEIESIGFLGTNQAVIYRTSLKGERLLKTKIAFDVRAANTVATFDASQKFQSIHGFGGAFTDSSGVLFNKLSPATQENLMRAYFGPNGAEYNMGRLPIGSTDFSLYEYGYDDVEGDFGLTNFNLSKFDYENKIPMIKWARELTGGNLRLVASPWSAPAWMKTNGKMVGGGYLQGDQGGQYYQTYADYLIRFLEEYSKEGIPIWAITTQNEPTTGFEADYGWQTMAFNETMQRDFIRDIFGPKLRQSAFGGVLILAMDDNRFCLPSWADTVFSDPVVNDYVAGIAVHWYEDWIYPVNVLSLTNERWPNKFVLATEGCNGYLFWDKGVKMGNFERAEKYMHDILDDMTHFVTGWIDWNLLLDETGGPTFAGNNVDAPIIVYTGTDEFVKQPTFYAMAHVSKFIKPGSVHVSFSLPADSGVQAVGFLLPDNRKAIVALNKGSRDFSYSISDASRPGQYLNVDLPARSMYTLIWE